MDKQIDGFHFQKFADEHFDEYNRWFSDFQLKSTLGGIDEEWLTHVLADEKGIELVAFQNKEQVAVIGLLYPTVVECSYAITNIAIRPDLRNKGLGSQILTALFKCFSLKTNEYWLCFVDKANLIGQRFFEKNGWSKQDDGDMFKYTRPRP